MRQLSLSIAVNAYELRTLTPHAEKSSNICSGKKRHSLITKVYSILLRGLLSLAATLLAQIALSAQQTSNPSLDLILQQLEANLQHYDAQVPSFSCSEHVVSLLVYPKHRQSTVTDSIFRLKRVVNPNNSTKLVESREIVSVNGSPANGEKLGGPTILEGVFSRGIDLVSLSQRPCMSYVLKPTSADNKDNSFVVQFTTLPDNQRPSNCAVKEDGAGRVFIDPTSMQVLQMEVTVSPHTIAPGLTGVWNIFVNYVPVELGGQTFWLPKTITSTLSPDHDSPTTWSFDAGYSNCRKFEVTSRVLPFAHSNP